MQGLKKTFSNNAFSEWPCTLKMAVKYSKKNTEWECLLVHRSETQEHNGPRKLQLATVVVKPVTQGILVYQWQKTEIWKFNEQSPELAK